MAVKEKAYLIQAIEVYVRDRIEFAGKVIADNAKEKIRPGDTVVTYARFVHLDVEAIVKGCVVKGMLIIDDPLRSSVVERVLLEAWWDMQSQDLPLSFNVVIVDSRPLNEGTSPCKPLPGPFLIRLYIYRIPGRALLTSLTNANLPCTYILLPLLSTVLPRASLILFGASALHSDGALYSRSGTALVAMLAKEHRVPVVACVETYKFGERVVLDGVASNELGDPEVMMDVPGKKGSGAIKAELKNLTLMSLMYDLTPPDLITAVCTEVRVDHPLSLLRLSHAITKLILVKDRIHPTQFGTNSPRQNERCHIVKTKTTTHAQYIMLPHSIAKTNVFL